jgi:hypothetical protein
MPSQREPLIHSYKVSRGRRWDQFNAHALVQSLLGSQPERWHLEGSPRVRTDRFGWTETRRYYRLHYRRNGEWRRRYIRLVQARKLLYLGITNATATGPRPHQKL